MTEGLSIRYHEITADMRGLFDARGFEPRHFFPHRLYFIPTCGPDHLKLAEAMCGIADPRKLWVIGLHATGGVVRTLPYDLFFDRDLVWHEEHYGLPAHVAFATVAVDRTQLRVLNCVSDVVQRQSRKPAYSARINDLFRSWYHMLFNAILYFACEQGLRTVHTPTADLVMRNTDRRRTVGAELFVRVYDGTAIARYRGERRQGWWMIDVRSNAARVIPPLRRSEHARAGKTICLSHDIERGLGHGSVDPVFAASVEEPAATALDRMLSVELDAGIRGTYNVVGCLFEEIHERIAAHGHCLGFHSYDHSIRGFSPGSWLRLSRSGRRLDHAGRPLVRALRRPTPPPAQDASLTPEAQEPSLELDQPQLCRSVDYRIRGYRPPQSKITLEANDFNLVLHNYRWLASSTSSLGVRAPAVENRLVKIPVAFDDFPLHTRELGYEAWKRELLRRVDTEEFAAISVHDCYANHWLHDYRDLLDQLGSRGQLRTLDEVAWQHILCTAV